MHGDRLAGFQSLGEVLALQDARHRVARGEADHPFGAELVRPLGVEQDVGLLRVEDLERLLAVGLRVLQDLLARQRRPRLVLAGGIADHAREVADEELHPVAELLEVAQLVDHHGVPEVQVGRRGIEPELDAQRRAARELLRELLLDDQLLGTALDERERLGHRGLLGLTHGRSLLD